MSNLLEMDSKLFNYHNFEKVNLVGDERGNDEYRCEDCGLVGIRRNVSPVLALKRPYAKKLKVCDGVKPKFNKKSIRESEESGGSVMIIDGGGNLAQFGFSDGETHQTVPCPKNQNPELNGVWVYSDKRGEPVRLLLGEYKVLGGE